MSQGTLPHRVNIRKAVTRSAQYSGVLSAEQLPQFSDELPPEASKLQLTVDFAEDDGGRQFLAVEMDARVRLECQRCLGMLTEHLHSSSRLALVHDDEQARALPAGFEPWIAIDEVDLWELAAEELALALPVVAYHPRGECGHSIATAGNDSVTPDGQDRTNDQTTSAPGASGPFSMLASLLDGDDDEEKT